MVPRENKSNTYVKFWKANEEYYGIFESGLLHLSGTTCAVIGLFNGPYSKVRTT